MATELIGTIEVEDGQIVQKPSNDMYREVLDKLYKRMVPCRPITLSPVRSPATAPGGQ